MFWRDSQSTYQAWCMKTHWLKAAELQSTDDLAIHRMLEQHQMQAHKERERRTSGSGETLTNKATPSCVNTHSAGHSPPTQTLLWRTNGVDSCADSAPNYTNISDKRWTTTTTTTAKNLAAHCSCVSKWIFVLLCFVFTLWGNLSVLVQAKQTDDFIIYKYQRFQTLIQLVPRGEQASPVLYVLVFPVLVSTATPQSVRLYALLSMHT